MVVDYNAPNSGNSNLVIEHTFSIQLKMVGFVEEDGILISIDDFVLKYNVENYELYVIRKNYEEEKMFS